MLLYQKHRNDRPAHEIIEQDFPFVTVQLPFYNEDYTQTLDELKLKYNIQSKNDNSDLKHIAYAISGEAEYFITRDEYILKNSETFSEYGINIYRPSEFITHYDENLQSSKYKPQKLIGTNISTTNISSQNVDAIISMFLTNHENIIKFRIFNIFF